MEKLNYLDVTIHIESSYQNAVKWLDLEERQTVFLVDDNVFTFWGHLFENQKVILIPSGEAQKSLSFAEVIIEQLIDHGLDRHSQLVGVGGGVVCDLTGFIASVFMRGIRFTLVPTTLLSMTDAAIGGKNGVNTQQYKNMIGLINQPWMILCATSFLSTLPKDELINGLAESIKHACIQSATLFNFIEANLTKILSLEEEVIGELIQKSANIKCEIVEKDPTEKHLRKTLNYGHTFGHAIEKAYKIPHGKAISLGMIIANSIACQRNQLTQQTSDKVCNLLSAAGLPVDISVIDMEKLTRYVKKDKKKKGDTLDMIFIEEIGKISINSVSFEELLALEKEVI